MSVARPATAAEFGQWLWNGRSDARPLQILQLYGYGRVPGESGRVYALRVARSAWLNMPDVAAGLLDVAEAIGAAGWEASGLPPRPVLRAPPWLGPE